MARESRAGGPSRVGAPQGVPRPPGPQGVGQDPRLTLAFGIADVVAPAPTTCLGGSGVGMRPGMRTPFGPSGSTLAEGDQPYLATGYRRTWCAPGRIEGYEWNLRPTPGTKLVRNETLSVLSTDAWVAELEERFLPSDCVGALLPFEFRMGPQKLWGSLRRAEPRLFQLDRVRMGQEGHALRYVVTGPLLRFRNALLNEDRKSLSRWAANQLHYAALDAQHLHTGSARGLKACLRRAGWMPLLAFLAAYVRAGGPLRGAAAKAYAAERAGYESLLSLQLSRLRLGIDPAIPRQAQSREVSPR